MGPVPLPPDGIGRERPWVLLGYLCSCSQSLRKEVTELTHSLRHAETENKVLQEALEGQLDPSCQLIATNWIQEKVSLSQEVIRG